MAHRRSRASNRGNRNGESGLLGGVESPREISSRGRNHQIPTLPLSTPRALLGSLSSLASLSPLFPKKKKTRKSKQYASDTLDTHQSMKRTIRKSKQVVQESESEEEEEIVVR